LLALCWSFVLSKKQLWLLACLENRDRAFADNFYSPSFMIVHFNNDGSFECCFSVQWDGGQTDRTSEVGMGNSGGGVDVDLSNAGIPDGTNCWARAYIIDGPNHDSADSFTYHANGNEVTYTISRTTFNPSFSCDGC
jgi:hypothetical protein